MQKVPDINYEESDKMHQLQKEFKKVRKQKREKAFNDPKTHKIDEEGNVLPKDKKRVRRAPNRLNL